MKIEKAIEIKQIYHNCNSQRMTPDERNADNMSIGALKRYQEERARNADPFGRPLPGETED